MHVMSLMTFRVEIVPTPVTVIVVASRPPFAYKVPLPAIPTVKSPKQAMPPEPMPIDPADKLVRVAGTRCVIWLFARVI